MFPDDEVTCIDQGIQRNSRFAGGDRLRRGDSRSFDTLAAVFAYEPAWDSVREVVAYVRPFPDLIDVAVKRVSRILRSDAHLRVRQTNPRILSGTFV